jgi:hypothetical protein
VVRWPHATIDVPAVWADARARWESPDGTTYFDEAAAEFAEQFFPACLQHHIGTEWNGRPFELMDYQRVIVRALFGWKRAADGWRRFRKVFLAVPKGNGKSPFGAALGLYLAFFDGEAGAEVYCVAADRQNARIVFDSATMFVKRNPDLAARLELFRDHIDVVGSNERLHVISSDASTKHGFRPHGIIFDEFHAQPDRVLFDTLYRGMGKRRQPVLVMITTAGDDDESICFEEWDYARRVISGSVDDATYFPMIFELQPDEDWASPAALRRVNLPIVFLPECLTVSYVQTDFPGLLEFTNRQVLITRVYSPKMWVIAGTTHLLFCATILLGIYLTLANLFAGRPSLPFAALTFLPLLLASIRSALRITAVQELLPTLKSQVQQQLWIYMLLGVWIPFLYLGNFIVSLVTKKIRWRGIRYELVSSQQTRIIAQ